MTTMVTSSARQRVAKSLESESASIVVILGGFAVVAASILGAGVLRQPPATDATLAVAAAQAVDVGHRNGIAAGSAIGSPIAATTDLDHGAEGGYRDGVAFSSRDTGAMAMQEAIAVGMPSSTEIRLTDGGPATPAPPRHSEWWWMPVGLVTAGATVTALRAGLRRRQAESRFAPEDVAAT